MLSKLCRVSPRSNMTGVQYDCVLIRKRDEDTHTHRGKTM